MASVRVGALIACLLQQGAAHAQPAASLHTVAGASGSIELRAGERKLAELKPATPVARRGEPQLKEVQIEGRRVVEVRLPIKEEDAAEVWLAAIGTGGASILWSGRVGTLDADGELGQQTELVPEGLYVYQTLSRISRCDAQPVRLFVRRYDFATRRWKQVAPPLPPVSGPAIVARRASGEAPAGRPRVSFPFTMSSVPPVDAPARAVSQLVAPLALNDGDPETVWAEGDPGDGRGEVLTARSGTAGHAVVGLRVLPGDTRSFEQFTARARPRSLLLALGPRPEERFEVTLEERDPPTAESYRKPFWIPLPRPVVSSCVTIIVREVTPGARGPERATSAWGDVEVFTDIDGQDGVSRLVGSLEGADCEPRVADVVAIGPDALPGLATALGRAQGAALDCLLEALERLAQARPLAGEPARPLATALPRALRLATPAQERTILALLSRLTDAPVQPLAALLRDGSAAPEERARAGRALAALAASGRPEVWDILMGQLGQGPAELRAVLRGLCAGAPPGSRDGLLSALKSAPPSDAGRKADLVWVLGVVAARPGLAPAPAVGSLLTALAGDGTGAFEVRARALMALGQWPEEAALAPLVKVRAGSPDAALRLVAARALAARPEVAALPPLRAAVDDSDPAVRQTAVEALSARRDPAATALIIAAAKQEPWPSVRRAEIAALGQLCGPGAGDLIVRAVERDVDDVRRAALRALVSCKDPRAPRLLLSVLSERREKPSLRTQASSLLAELKDGSTAEGLATALDRLLVEAQSDLALEATATGTLRALAELGGPVALRAALRIRSDPRPVLRRSASEALGKLCDPGAGAQALRAATRDPDAAVAAAATAALRRCGSAHK